MAYHLFVCFVFFSSEREKEYIIVKFKKLTIQILNIMWEKLKEFVKRINDLKNENENLKRTIDNYSNYVGDKLLADLQEEVKEIEKELTNLKEKASDKVTVHFVGITSSGKSSLINCLLRDDRLPVGWRKCTISSIRVCTTPDETWSVMVDAKKLEKDDKEAVKHLFKILPNAEAKEEQKRLEITQESVVEFFWPKHLCTKLPHNVVLVDLPGYVQNPSSSEVTDRSSEKADIIVAVMRADTSTPELVSSVVDKSGTFLFCCHLSRVQCCVQYLYSWQSLLSLSTLKLLVHGV